jgi:predicted RNase H-like nuclease
VPSPDRPADGLQRVGLRLKAKLRQADELRARLRDRLFEVHPELCFAELNAGIEVPVAAAKKSWNDQMTRRALLASTGIRLPDYLAEAGTTPPDDILNAASAAWTASRIASGHAAACRTRPNMTTSATQSPSGTDTRSPTPSRRKLR